MDDTYLLTIAFGLLLGACLILVQFYFGAPFLPSHNKAVEWMLELAQKEHISRMVDLGSGNGKIVIAFAQKGIESHGYEINPFLVWVSRWRIRRQGLESIAYIHQANFWKKDFSSFDLVTVFGMDHFMEELAVKIKKEMPPKSIVLSNAFILPGMNHADKAGTVFKYIV